MKTDYFEMDRVIEDLAKSYAAPCATTWFKVTANKKPSKEEYRNKVVEFMNHFETVLSSYYPSNLQTKHLQEYAKSGLQKAIYGINNGNNKEVERRYQYYTSF